MEYLSRKKVKPARLCFGDIIALVREDLREEEVTFVCNIIGSAKRNLVLISSNPNKGFDCDYCIEIKSNKNDLNAKVLKDKFMNSFDNHILEFGFSNCSDSTQAITIPKVKRDDCEHKFGFDIIITKMEDKMMILRNDKKAITNENGKEEDNYHFVEMSDRSYQGEQFKKINGYKMWKELREKYKDKCTGNENNPVDNKRKHYQLLSEVVNDVLKNNNIN